MGSSRTDASLWREAVLGAVPACCGVPAAFLAEAGRWSAGIGGTELLNQLRGVLCSGGIGV